MPRPMINGILAVCTVLGAVWNAVQLAEWLSVKPLWSLVLSVPLMFAFPLWFIYRKIRSWRQDFAVGSSGRHGTDFLVGETVRFEVRFRGELRDALFTCKLRPPEHTTLPDSDKDYVWWANYKTYDEPKDLGLLNGRGSTRFLLFWKAHKYVWGNKIPFNYPAGKYGAHIEIYNDGERGKPFRSIEKTFTVTHEDLVPLLGGKGGFFVKTPTFH